MWIQVPPVGEPCKRQQAGEAAATRQAAQQAASRLPQQNAAPPVAAHVYAQMRYVDDATMPTSVEKYGTLMLSKKLYDTTNTVAAAHGSRAWSLLHAGTCAAWRSPQPPQPASPRVTAASASPSLSVTRASASSPEPEDSALSASAAPAVTWRWISTSRLCDHTLVLIRSV